MVGYLKEKWSALFVYVFQVLSTVTGVDEVEVEVDVGVGDVEVVLEVGFDEGSVVVAGGVVYVDVGIELFVLVFSFVFVLTELVSVFEDKHPAPNNTTKPRAPMSFFIK